MEKKKNGGIYFAISDCPLWVFQGVCVPAKEKFKDIYWVRIAELLQIEKQYNAMLALIGQQESVDNGVQVQEEQRIEEEKVDEPVKRKYVGQ